MAKHPLIFGYNPKTEKEKKFLSFSAIALWNKNKEDYRERYYRGGGFKGNKYTVFGYEAENQVYAGKVPGVPCWSEQHKLFTEVEGVPILGYLDTFNEETKQFADYKSSLKPWTRYDVESLDQLPFYSMLVEKIYGEVHPVCNLVWLETAERKPTTLLNNGEELYLTGKFEVFSRRVLKWERKRMVDYVVKAAEEIAQDYFLYSGGVENPPRFGV